MSEQDQPGSGIISEEVVPSGGESGEETKSEGAPDGQPSAPQFSHPLLRGKSPEEIERIFATQDEALRSQNEELNRLTSRVSAPPPEPTKEEEPDYGDDFLAPRFKTLEARLKAQLDKTIAPLREETVRGRASGARSKLRSELKHFTQLEPYVDTLLRNQGVNPETANENQLRMLYHTAVGVALERGIPLTGQPSAPPPSADIVPPAQPSQTPPTMIPQHRPSSAPLPQPPKPAVRQLTEEEKRLARVYFPTAQDPEGEYRTYQDMASDEIVTPGFSKENW